MACLAGVVVLAWFEVVDDVEHLRRDLWAAFAQVYNWVVLSSGQTYADLVGADEGVRSPLDHYWSLAIEEQFYWVWPLAMVLVLRTGRRRRVLLVGALALAAAVAPVIAAVWGGGGVLGDARASARSSSGALVAVVLNGRWCATCATRPVAWLAVGGIGVVAWAALTWPSGAGPARDGWLPVFALASAGVIVGVQVASPLRRCWPCGRSSRWGRSVTASTSTTGRCTSCSTSNAPVSPTLRCSPSVSV